MANPAQGDDARGANDGGQMSSLRALMAVGAAFAAAVVLTSPARAADDDDDGPGGDARKVDTEFIFGWTQGADVGELHERELEFQNDILAGKRTGRYTAAVSQLRYETSPLPNLRLEIGAPFSGHDISGVAGLDHRSGWAFQGLSGEVKYKLLSREKAPLGLSVSFEPHWSKVDDLSGEAVQNYGTEFTLAADKELVADQLFVAANLSYEAEVSRGRGAAGWDRQSTLGAAFSATRQWAKGVFIGGEARWRRAYNSAGLSRYAGEALFIGPTVFLSLTDRVKLSGAWTVQAAGGEHGSSAALDLADFHRHQAMIRLEYNF
jgi:hypothetical protein